MSGQLKPVISQEDAERLHDVFVSVMAGMGASLAGLADAAATATSAFHGLTQLLGPVDLDQDPDAAYPDTSQAYFLDLIKRIDTESTGA